MAAALFSDVAKAFIVGDRLVVLTARKAGPDWAGRKPSALRAEEGVQVLFRNGKLEASDEPLAADEMVLAGRWRRVAPAWSES